MLRSVIQTAPGATPDRWCWLLHGILGSAQNLRTVARRLCDADPSTGYILPDLRRHGESHDESPPDTVGACAGDLDRLAAHLGRAPTAAIGHSFGGKVALVWAEATEARGARVDRVWALDVPPGRPDLPVALHSDVVQVVRALRTVPVPLPRRDAIVGILTGLGFTPGLAQWMTTNLRPTDAGFVWRFDLDGVEALLRSYAEADAWPWLTSTTRRARVDVVRGGRSERWTDAEIARFGANPSVRLHVLPDAGHWLHVDDLDGLVSLILREGGAAP